MTKKILTRLSTITLLLLTSTPMVRAGGGSFSINVDDQVKDRVAINEDLGTFVSRSFSAVILVAGLATFMYLVYGGVSWITAGGDKGKLDEARSKITQAIVGLGIVASAWAVYLLVDYFFGIGITK